MRNKFLIGIIVFAVLAAQISCSQIRQAELERSRSLWLEKRIENYKMKIKIQKTGHATPNGTFIITVRDNAAESIKPSDKPDLEMLDTQIRFERYSTIDAIFNFIESAEKDRQKNNNSWDRRVIEYDAKYGYPKKVDLDQSDVMDDELYFEVLEFEIEASSGIKPAEKPSPPKIISVPAEEITKAEFSVSSRDGDHGGMSFSKDGTAFRSYRSINFDANVNESNKKPEFEKYQAVTSEEQFKQLAHTLAENDFSNLKDTTERSPDQTDYVLTITYAGKTKSIKMSLTGKNTAEIQEILNAFEKLKNQLDWQEIK